jgi:hypothetical protein
MFRGRPIVVIALMSACSGRSSSPARNDAGSEVAVTAPLPTVELPALALGAARLEDFAWQAGPGRESFTRALAAEKALDWPGAITACRQALAADAGHLDAAWLLAAALVRHGELDAVLVPLARAATGDWAKWGERSLDLALFAPFRATAAGAAWERAGARHRELYRDAIAHAVVVVARPGRGDQPPGADRDRRGDLFAHDVGSGRWLRLTRTGGAVAAGLDAPSAPLHAYVAYRTIRSGGRAGAPAELVEVAVGVVDRTTGKLGREVALGDAAAIALAWQNGRGEPRLEVEVTPAGARPVAQRWRLDWRRGSKVRLTEGSAGERLEVTPAGGRRIRPPAAGVRADWDGGAASAFRIDSSRKTVAPPALVDGATLVWSPDEARLAFATAPADPCGEGEARAVRYFVVDAASGRLREVGRGDGPGQVRWIDASRLAVVSGDGVRVIDAVRGDELATVAGGQGVALDALAPLRRCATAPDDDGPFAPPVGDLADRDEPAVEAPPEPDGAAPPAPGAATP